MVHTPTTDPWMRTHRLRTQADAQRVMGEQIRKLAKAGHDVAIHQDDDPRLARIDLGRWLISCACGAGVSVHPDWTEAYCFGCGAICTHVVFPEDRGAIEAVVAKRKPVNRFFLPERGETLEQLRFENMVLGVDPVPVALTETVAHVRDRLKGQL